MQARIQGANGPAAGEGRGAKEVKKLSKRGSESLLEHFSFYIFLEETSQTLLITGKNH